MKKNQIIKLKGQPANNLYRYGGEEIRDNLPAMYYVMELENKFKVWYANSLSCFLKPTIKDIIDYIDGVNEKKPDTIVARSIALTFPKQHLQAIKDSIRPRVYTIYNDSVALEQWENYIAVVLYKKSTDALPVVSIVNAKDLAEEVTTIDFEDIDLELKSENYSIEPQKENTIRFLSAEDGTLLFADKEFELSKFDNFLGPFDASHCELEFWSRASLINAQLRAILPSVCGIVRNCGIAYEVSEIQNIYQEPAYNFVTGESGFNVKIIFKKSRLLSGQGRDRSKLKLGLSSNYEDDPVIQKAIHISELDAEITSSKGENDVMKINSKALKQIIIDEDRKTVTAIATDDPSVYNHYLGLEPMKYVTVAKAADEDDFDPYVGVAMTLAYQLFGSKENFRKFVRENGLVKNLKKEREARAAAKKEAQEKAEAVHKKAVARKAKRAAKKAEKEEVVATELLKQLSKLLNKTDKRAKAEKGE